MTSRIYWASVWKSSGAMPKRVISCHLQALVPERPGKSLRVSDNGLLVGVPETVHLINRRQETQKGSQMVVADAPRKGPVLYCFPEGVLLFLLPPVSGNHSPLGAEEGFMGGAGDQIRPLGKRLLEVGPRQSQDMGHVVEDDGLDPLFAEEIPDLPDRLPAKDHALAEDAQIGRDHVWTATQAYIR